MKLFGVRIFVDDLERARAFYGETLGLPEAWRLDEARAAGFAAGEAQLIVEEETTERELVGRFVGVSLLVEDIAAAHERLAAAGVVFESPPEKQPWGGTLAHFRDPAGNVLTLLG